MEYYAFFKILIGTRDSNSKTFKIRNRDYEQITYTVQTDKEAFLAAQVSMTTTIPNQIYTVKGERLMIELSFLQREDGTAVNQKELLRTLLVSQEKEEQSLERMLNKVSAPRLAIEL